MRRKLTLVTFVLLAFAATGFCFTAERPEGIIFVEAESFEKPGGWKLDTQFIGIMGSPYMLAHGLGKPVDDASTTVTFPETGEYSVYVRTKDWVAGWNAPGTPGKFQLVVDGTPLAEPFGTKGAEWHWQPGGKVTVTIGSSNFELFTKDEGAFIEKTEDEGKLAAAMKAGNAMTVKGRSARGTNTSDNYSLSGATAALERIAKECAEQQG